MDPAEKKSDSDTASSSNQQIEQIVKLPSSNDPNLFLLVDELSGIDLSQDIPSDAFQDKDQSPKKLQNPQRLDQKQNYKSSRSIRQLRRPQPQPHVCCKDKTIDGRDVFINVLSWSKILKPKNPLHPIPLFGGNRVLTTNPKMSEELIYCVTANPEVLEKTRRTGGNTQAQQALMCLMTEFVEEMNPGLKLMKQPVIIENRDLIGELKDIWITIQAKRERDKMSALELEMEKPGMIYEEFGPESARKDVGSSHTTTEQIKSNDKNLENSMETNSKNELHPAWPSIPPDLQNDSAAAKIDFSINPYLVPYPELDSLVKIVMDSLDCTTEVQEAKLMDDNNDETDNQLKQNNIIKDEEEKEVIIKNKEVKEEIEVKEDLAVGAEKEEKIIERKIEENFKDGNEKQQQQHQLESFKKSIEFLTNGCHNFFLFKSKSTSTTTSDGSNNNNCNKKTKEKGKKIKIKSNDDKKTEPCSNSMIHVERKNDTSSEDIAIKT